MGSVIIEGRNVGKVIGPKGATIRQLQEEFNVRISIARDGNENGNRLAELEGEAADVARAIAAIQERFSGSSDYRGRDDSRQFNNQSGGNRDRSAHGRNDGYQQNFARNASQPQQQSADDDEWDNPTPAPKQQAPKSTTTDDDWGEPTTYKPSANTYTSERPSTEPRNYSSNSSSAYDGFGRGRGGRASTSYNHHDENRSSSYSSGNRIAYREHYDPPPPVVQPQAHEEFVPIDWDAANKTAEAARKARWAACPKMHKDFYVVHPEVTNMTEEDAELFRRESLNIVVSRTFAEEGSTEEMPKPTTKFEHAFEKFPDLMGEIKKAGFEKPSPIQSQMWPILLSGEDCIGIAQTGTGKTLAFLLPAMIHTDGQPHPRGTAARGGPNVLVLAPTRELAIQIEMEVSKYQFRGIRAVCLYGGADRKKQIDAVESGVEIIIATPGRLNDLVNAGHIKIESVTFLILDEADRMLDLGFEPQIRKLLLDIRDDRQTVMTSATWPPGVRRLASSYMSNPFQVFVGSLDLTATHTVTQKLEFMDEEEKFNRIIRFAKHEMTPEDKAIIFCGKKDRADSLSCDFALEGINCQAIHGNREQSDREQALADIKSGEVRILIATDVASRGIDVPDITYVVNYDFPRNIEEYVHRVGRTGRAERLGTSLSFLTRSDWGSAADLITIMKEAEQQIPQELQDMADRFKARKERDRSERGFGGRGGGRGGGGRGGRDGGGGGFRGGNRGGGGGNRW